MDVFKQLRTTKHFTEAEHAVVDYILSHPEEVTALSGRELARRSLTNPMTVTRLYRKLGFDTLDDFKVRIVYDLKRANVGDHFVRTGDGLLAGVTKVAALEKYAIDRTRELVSMEQLTRAVDLVRDANCVDLYARDANATVTRYGLYRFGFARKLAAVYDSMDPMTFHAYAVPQDHAILFISRRGRDREMLAAARNLKNAQVPIIAIVGETGSPLAHISSAVLEGFYRSDRLEYETLLFHNSAKYLIDVLSIFSSEEGPDLERSFAQQFLNDYLESSGFNSLTTQA